jgi:hypothetical protein
MAATLLTVNAGKHGQKSLNHWTKELALTTSHLANRL